MRVLSFFALALLLFFPSLSPAAAPEPSSEPFLKEIWDHYYPKQEPITEKLPAGPGRCVGDSPELRSFAFASHWDWRDSVYELYFASSVELARSIYGLALNSGDVDKDMPLDRFEKGVFGFHYGLDQICDWASKALHGTLPFHTKEERQFLDYLLLDGIIDIRNGKVVPGSKVRHVLGAAHGKKRGFATNLAHERLHVLWDEDISFKLEGKALWNKLTPVEKDAVYKSLPGYSKEKEAQIIEEWHVRQAEKAPLDTRKILVGI